MQFIEYSTKALLSLLGQKWVRMQRRDVSLNKQGESEVGWDCIPCLSKINASQHHVAYDVGTNQYAQYVMSM